MSRTSSLPATWSPEWAYEKAARAARYLGDNYPDCGGSEALDPYHEAVHEAAMKEDRGAYEEALRQYMRVGRREALKIRKGAA